MPNQSVVDRVKDHLTDNYNLSYNLVNRNIQINGRPVTDIDLNTIYIACKTNCSTATKDLVYSIIYSSHTQQANPFISFITTHKNSTVTGGDIDKLIASISTDTANYELFIRKWLCAIMASIHGNHSPLVLVLCGGQNSGKTEWFRRLLPVELAGYYAESKLDSGKDDEILMTKKLIILDDEMGGKSKQENKKLKEMTSKQTFSIREPYGRVSVDLQRLAMLCGTTNDLQVLNDPTGNRRLLPVHVLGIDHTLYNSIDKTALFIEIYNLYKSGYNYNLTRDDIELLNSSTGDFEAVSTEEELLLTYYAVPDEYSYKIKEATNTEILSRLKTWSGINVNQTRLGLVLKKLGFEQKIIRVGKSTRRVYLVVELNP
jgi:predicted P-loop ATPase